MSRRSWLAGAVLALVVAVIVTVAVLVQYTDGQRPGAAFPGVGRIDSAHEADVKLPVGTLKVQVGTPSQEYDVDFDQTERAADGAVFVPVGWELQGAQTGVSNSVPAYQFQLTLVADGRRYDLQAGHEDDPAATAPVVVASGAVAAVVEGDGENVSVEVEYDGLTQVLDVDSGKIDSGLAAPYYARAGLPSRSAGPCSALSAADQKAFLLLLDACKLGPVTFAPYVGGFGWVGSKTETWVTVPYSFQVGSIDGRAADAARYSVSVRSFDMTLDGVEPVADVLRYRSTTYLGGVKVFRTSASPRALRLVTEIAGDSNSNGAGVWIFRNDTALPLR